MYWRDFEKNLESAFSAYANDWKLHVNFNSIYVGVKFFLNRDRKIPNFLFNFYLLMVYK